MPGNFIPFDLITLILFVNDTQHEVQHYSILSNLLLLPLRYKYSYTLFSETLASTQGDYKWCERLRKFIGKKVIAIQILNSHHCKEQLKKLLFERVRKK
jgi:hypothetical protein